jgi:hypothetical protein
MISVRLWLAAGVLLVACTPTLDWREVRPSGTSLVALMPCKPTRQVRPLPLGGAPVPVELLACAAGGTTWSLTAADLGDAARVPDVLTALRSARARNLEGQEIASQTFQVTGMTPYPQAVRFLVSGRRPDGEPLVEHAVVFAQGPRVFQAAALGGKPLPDALETFFGGLRLQP